MKERVGKVHLDRFSLTLRTLLITFLLALPGPVLMFFIAGWVDGSNNISIAFSDALVYGALTYLILGFAMQSVRECGLVGLHFKWHAATVEALNRNLPWFTAVFVPAIVLSFLLEAQSSAAIRDSLGRITFIATTLILATFAYQVLNPTRGILKVGRTDVSAASDWQIRYLGFPLVILLPLIVAGLSIYGYHYTAVQLDAYLLKSLLVVLAGVLLFCLAERAIAINERRLTLGRVRAKRAAAIAKSEDRQAAELAGEGLPTEVDLQEIDLQTISSQSRELLKMVVAIGVGLALLNVWAELLPAFKPLIDVTLWGSSVFANGAAVSSVVTLWDLLVALTLVAITFLAVRNVPSLLEVALLSRLTLEAGTNYAVTTIVRYLIVIGGSIVTLSLLGAEWSKLQWLIAALGVGLGFGLQEIVANFVSGIVLLFERPIRIGDTVTIGEESGTVSRIRIRATTIVDWDRREIVIPNKTFITERLINWTLTDPISRTTIRVGVAYGSDVALTEKLLFEIAKANSRVLEDPPPAVVLICFGDSSLSFELRIFVKGIRELIPVTHEIHVAIDAAFRENHIEIAFPQRDLHLDSKPIEIQLSEPTNRDRHE